MKRYVVVGRVGSTVSGFAWYNTRTRAEEAAHAIVSIFNDATATVEQHIGPAQYRVLSEHSSEERI